MGDEAKLEQQRLAQAGLQQLEADTRALIQRTSEEHGGKHATLQSMLEALDATLRGHDQKYTSLHSQSQSTFSEHKLQVEKLVVVRMDGLKEMVQNEKTERFRHHASLQER